MNKFACAVALCLAVCGSSAFGQVAPAAVQPLRQEVPSTADVNIPFRLSKYNNIVIPAILNGNDKVDLMLHTASYGVSLTEDGAKKAPSVQMDEQTNIESWGGATAARCSVSNTLQIGTLSWDDVRVMEGKHSGRETDGKFGLNLLGEKIVALDFDKNLLRIQSALPSDWKSYDRVRAEFRRGSVFVNCTLGVGSERINHDLMIHSGYSGGLLLDDEFVARHKFGDRLEVTKESELKDSIGNILTTKHANLPSLRVGKRVFHDVPVGFFAGAIGKQRIGVFGGDLIKRFNLLIDVKNKTLYLKPNDLAKAEWV